MVFLTSSLISVFLSSTIKFPRGLIEGAGLTAVRFIWSCTTCFVKCVQVSVVTRSTLYSTEDIVITLSGLCYYCSSLDNYSNII